MDLNISRQRILTKFQQHKTLEDLQKSGRLQRNDDRCERLLIRDTRCLRKKRHVSFTLIGDHVNQLQCKLNMSGDQRKPDSMTIYHQINEIQWWQCDGMRSHKRKWTKFLIRCPDRLNSNGYMDVLNNYISIY